MAGTAGQACFVRTSSPSYNVTLSGGKRQPASPSAGAKRLGVYVERAAAMLLKPATDQDTAAVVALG